MSKYPLTAGNIYIGVAPAKRAKRTLRLLSYITTARNILCMIENSLAVGNFRET